MSKFVHIVFGDSAAGVLRYFFSNSENEFKGKIISFREDHSIGPIYEIDTKEGLKKRIVWFEKILNEICVYDYFENIYEEFINTYESIKNIEADSKIIMWYGENIGDEVGIRYLSSILKNRELYEVNVSQSYIRAYNGNMYRPRAFGECNPEEIGNLISTMKRIEKEKCDNLIEDWKILRKSKENLRILEHDKIIGVNEDYYDNDILSNCVLDFRKAPRVVGETMGKSEQLIGDTYIDYRIRKLIESGKLEYRGKLETMRDFEVRTRE